MIRIHHGMSLLKEKSEISCIHARHPSHAHSNSLSLMRMVDTVGDLQGKSAAVFPVGAQLNAKQLLRKMDMCIILKPS